MNNPLSDKEKVDIYNNQQDHNQNQNDPLLNENNNQIDNLGDFSSGKNDINNQNINMEEANEINSNYDNYNSDIDDPKYRPNSNLFLNQDENGIIFDEVENINNNYIPNKYKTFSTNFNKNNINLNFRKLNNYSNCFKFHNYDNININQDNLCQNKSVFELQTENNLLKNELYKKAQIIKNKDEIINEFQNLITTFKTKFEQYEAKNNQLKQKIIFLEKQLNSKNNNIILNSNKKDINTDINNNNNIFYKQHIKELEIEYDSKIKKLNEKFKEKENLLKKDKNDEILRISKNLEEKKFENEKLKSEISNYKIEINALKSQIENNDYEKNSIMD